MRLMAFFASFLRELPVQFPLDQELPIGLIQKIIQYRLSEMQK